MTRSILSVFLCLTPIIAWAQTPVVSTDSLARSVVQVRNTSQNSNTSWGSGCWIDETHILTCLHVVFASSSIDIIWEGKIFHAEIASVEPAGDWSLLELSSPVEGVPIAELRESEIKFGEAVVGYGFGSVHDGKRMMAMIQGRVDRNCIRGSQKPRNGDSGGPIFDSNGRLIGVINSRVEEENEWYGHSIGPRLFEFCRGRSGFRRR